MTGRSSALANTRINFVRLACWAAAMSPPFLLAASPVIDKVKPVVPLKVVPFDMEDVRLLPGPFRHAMELDAKYVLALDPDRLLHNFRINAGLPSSARPLGGWEAPRVELRGHFSGHYLSACALLYASTGDERFKARGSQVVAGLAECQRKLGSGYVSAFPEEFIDRVERQRRVWAPWYTLHKILAGLLDMNEFCGSGQALDVARKFADWVKARTDRLSDAQMQAMLGNEHGGMNESLANLHARTGDARYLALAERFNHMSVIGPAAARRDNLTGLHANTQIPKFIGTAREYELTGKQPLQTASLFFWDTVVKERSYVIGGHSNGEMFSAKERLSKALGPNTTETCNTYNMLKLTRHLFEWDPRPEYADYYERALYNHILSSQDPQTGMMCYYVPLRSGSRKVYNSFDQDFWCCTGTGLENHAKYGDSIFYHDGNKTLYVNLFIASELSWKAAGVKLRQETRYPDEQGSRLLVTCPRPVKVALLVRHPGWVETGFAIKVNGQTLAVQSEPGSFEKIKRTWKDGDVVDIALPFRLRTEGFRENPKRLAFLHGPLVLAAEIDTRRPAPAIVTVHGEVLAGLQPVPGRPSTFAASPAVFRVPGQSSGPGFALEPFFKMHGNRYYVVYWDVLSPGGWHAREEEYAAELDRRKQVESRTVDQVIPGDDQNEREHQFEGRETASGVFGGRKWRDAVGGWFRYVVKVLPEKRQELSVTYWGSDSGRRAFDILVDGTKLAIERLENNHPDQFYDQTYVLPAQLLKGKSQIAVTFQAHTRQTAGGIFGLRVLNSDQWKLVWSDEFNEPGFPDPEKWSYETGFIANNEAQFYTRERKENARVEGGMLTIEARKERWPNPAFDPAKKASSRGRRNVEAAEYTSARLITRGKAAWTYGRIEARAKLPNGRGTWPAIWTLGTNIGEVGWPACGEIDIMENVGFEPGVIHANIHTKKYNHMAGTNKGDKISIADASSAFHVYAVEWDARQMDFFVDGRRYFTYRNEGSGEAAWPYDKEQFLILNLAIGGDWGGQKGIDNRIFPQRLLIDYVRVYQKAQEK
jgi:DUF1680 family protein/beta-glucanase (GH16 family)